MQLTIVAAGSRGDVQPYLALGRGLQKAGYEVQVCADQIFENLVVSCGLPFAPVTAAPVNFMQQNLSRLGGPFKLMGWLKRHFEPLARAFFTDLANATSHSDAILYSTLAFAGYHVAEKHGIRALGVYNVPITPTHAFQNPSFPSIPAWLPFRPAYNWWSFRFANQLFIRLIKPIVNECRREVLGLKPMANSFYEHLDISGLPLLYGFSPNLLPRPDDWGEWLQVAGHLFMDYLPAWQPPAELMRFLENGSPPVYVGFGSMVDEQIEPATKVVLGALQQCGQRGVLLGGWGRLGTGQLPESIQCIDTAPHDWLFPRVAAVVHHGGAGTTATGLRFGKPSVIVPFFADQPFWGDRVHALGCGPKPIPFKRMNIANLAKAIHSAVNDPGYCANASLMAEKLQAENGVARAVAYIRNYLDTGSLSTNNLP